MFLRRGKYLPKYVADLDYQVGIKVIQAALSNTLLVD